MSAQRHAFDRVIGAWNAGDLDRYLELYDDRISLHGNARCGFGGPVGRRRPARK